MQAQKGGEKAKQSLNQAAKLLNQNGFAKQLITGTASGWFTGAVVKHAGKGISLVLGSGIILHQIAHNQGIIKQDLDTLKELAQKKASEMSKNTPAIQKMRGFASKNKVFTAGFLGGFLIGVAL
ncbi:FUN14 domain-containing protein 1B-like [Tribolium madens]|uniref:FUN14 domain-containing protein 1B-like n=1 Tax=Tribolium madens TaxID=41895 RepID=UPI001CF71D97|nr:FUN14 domain-containing protein 1B-like [Tribolium madens]